MHKLQNLQSAFKDYILNAQNEIEEFVVGSDISKQARLFIYKNNYLVSVVDHLRSVFPAIEKLVGEKFFINMGQLFIKRFPPQSGSLIAYGAKFPDFIKMAPPLKEMEYLSEVARLEWAVHRAYFAYNYPPLDLMQIQKDPEHYLTKALNIDDKLSLVKTNFEIQTMWELALKNQKLNPRQATKPLFYMIYRDPEFEVVIEKIPESGYSFLKMLQQGSSFSEAASLALERDSKFDLQEFFAKMLKNEIIIQNL